MNTERMTTREFDNIQDALAEIEELSIYVDIGQFSLMRDTYTWSVSWPKGPQS